MKRGKGKYNNPSQLSLFEELDTRPAEGWNGEEEDGGNWAPPSSGDASEPSVKDKLRGLTRSEAIAKLEELGLSYESSERGIYLKYVAGWSYVHGVSYPEYSLSRVWSPEESPEKEDLARLQSAVNELGFSGLYPNVTICYNGGKDYWVQEFDGKLLPSGKYSDTYLKYLNEGYFLYRMVDNTVIYTNECPEFWSETTNPDVVYANLPVTTTTTDSDDTTPTQLGCDVYVTKVKYDFGDILIFAEIDGEEKEIAVDLKEGSWVVNRINDVSYKSAVERYLNSIFFCVEGDEDDEGKVWFSFRNPCGKWAQWADVKKRVSSWDGEVLETIDGNVLYSVNEVNE